MPARLRPLAVPSLPRLPRPSSLCLSAVPAVLAVLAMLVVHVAWCWHTLMLHPHLYELEEPTDTPASSSCPHLSPAAVRASAWGVTLDTEDIGSRHLLVSRMDEALSHICRWCTYMNLTPSKQQTDMTHTTYTSAHTSNRTHRTYKQPHAYTKHTARMPAHVLTSPAGVQLSDERSASTKSSVNKNDTDSILSC